MVGRESFTLSDQGVARSGNRVTVTYELPAGVAPQSVDPQAIVVVPDPVRVGETQLFLEVEGFSGLEPTLLSSEPIPVITNCPEPVEEDEPVNLTDGVYRTAFEADADGDGDNEPVICNDRPTAVSYSFTYSGDLDTWTSYFEGQNVGRNGEREFSLTSSAVEVEGNRVTVSYQLNPGSAPTLTAPDLDTQGIIVTPNVLGQTRLFVEVDGIVELSTPDIPVLAACEDQQERAVSITTSSYRTPFTSSVDGESADVICDDRQTDVTVRFEFKGDLESFILRAVGEREGREVEIATYDQTQIVQSGSFTGIVPFGEGAAPRLIAPGESVLSTQAIVISPDIIGETRFEVQPNQTGEFVPLDFEVPIAAVCPSDDN